MDKKQKVPDLLERLEDSAYSHFDVTCRPTGANYVYMVLDIAKSAVAAGLYNKIKLRDLEQLTTDNYHTARKAAQIIYDLQKEG